LEHLLSLFRVLGQKVDRPDALMLMAQNFSMTSLKPCALVDILFDTLKADSDVVDSVAVGASFPVASAGDRDSCEPVGRADC
jgi:hypothetical protein